MPDLIAVRYLLVGGKDYWPGDILPLEDVERAAELVENGAALWRQQAPAFQTAKPAAAMSGLPGMAVGGDQTGEDLVGRVPITPERKRS